MTFDSIIDKINGITLVSPDRCKVLYDTMAAVNDIGGSIAELGVYKGGTAYILASMSPNKTVHLFDTYEGIPNIVTDKDGIYHHEEGDFGDTSLESVKMFLKDFSNIEYHKGIFPSIADAVINDKFSLVHIDCDVYTGVIDSLEFFYHRLSTGGAMIFDDYEWRRCPGVALALSEFLEDKPESIEHTTDYQVRIYKL